MTLSETTQFQILFGTLSVPLLAILVSWLVKCEWSSNVKSLISLAVALVLGVISAWLAGKLTFGDYVETFTAVYTASHIFYITYFKKLPFNAWLQKQDVL